MSPKVEEGLHIRSPGDYLMKWGEDRHWYVSYRNCNLEDVWRYRSSMDGWPLGENDHDLVKGAALVAPLSILFWEDE